MKRIINYLLLAIFACTMFCCEEMDHTYKEYIVPNGIHYPGKATNPVVCPGRYRVKIQWLKGTDPKVVKAEIYWNNYTEMDTVDYPEDQDTISSLIGSLEENNYTFVIKTYDTEGNVSIPVEITGAIYGDIYQSGILNRAIKSSATDNNAEWKIEWEKADTKKGAFMLEFEYRTTAGVKKLLVPATENTTIIKDQQGGSEFKYRTCYLPDSLAIDTFYTDYSVGEIPLSPISKSGWTATASSDARDTQAPNGAPEKAIDSDITTFWHSKHKPSSPGYPHWLAFDMKKEAEVWQVQLTHRQSYPEQSFSGFRIQGSNDGATWTDYGSFTMLPQALVNQTFNIESKPRIRYIRVYMDVPGTTVHAHLGEFTALGFYTE